jgi:transglutaminase-like putative cysteine protease
MKAHLILLSILLSLHFCFAQEIVRGGVYFKIDIEASKETRKLQFTAIIPVDIEGVQKILDVRYSMKPVRDFIQDGNRYAVFIIDSVKPKNEISMVFDVELYRCDLETIKKTKVTRRGPTEPYLLAEPYLEANDPVIIATAKKLKSRDALRTIKNIYKFVGNHIFWESQTEERGAIFALKQKCGDSSEYTDLFVALCRACGIPAKRVCGYTTDLKLIPGHAWAEAYTNQYGWIRFDPTPGYDVRFEKLFYSYVQFSTTPNDPIMKNVPRMNFVSYWGGEVTCDRTYKYR